MLTGAQRLAALVAGLAALFAPGVADAALLQQGPPLSSGDPNIEMGRSAVLSDDGNTALIGGPTQGNAWIFTRSGAAWTRVADLLPAAGAHASEYGVDVALSADGTTAVVGSPAQDAYYNPDLNQNGAPGAAFVYVRGADGSWALQQKIAGGCCGGPHFGSAVAISGDGQTLAVGAPLEANSGAAYFYRRDGAAWTQTSKFMPGNSYGTAGHVGDGIGGDLALSSDGAVALVGSAHGAYVLARAADGTWSAQDGGPTLQGKPGSPDENSGWRVALSGDGRSALVAAYDGPRWMTRPDTSTTAWTPAGAPLAPFGPVAAPGPYSGPPPSVLGALALSRDGSTALAGAPGSKNEDQGTGWTFTRTASGWAPGARLAASDNTIYVGSSVALSADGATALLGGGQDKAFAFAHIPDVTAVAPALGSVVGGDTVAITGSDFTGATAVTFGSTPARSFTVAGPGELRAVVPPGARPAHVHVTVTGPMGVSPQGAGDQFTYARPVPAVRSTKASARRPRLGVACAVVACHGTVQLVSIVAHRRTTVATAPLRLAAGRTATVALRITPAGRRLLRRAAGRTLHLTARVVADGARPVSRRVALR